MHFKKYKSILSPQNGMNIYRGCSHGCIYCDSRSNCYQMEHDFEDIEVKRDAPLMLQDALKRKRKKGMIATGAMSDPYIPLEKDLGYTRQCLEHIYQYGFGLTLQTKSSLMLRDLDLLEAIHRSTKCVVQMTITTFNDDLCRIIEPKVASTKERLEVMLKLRDRGIPIVVWISPLLPFINDTAENLLGLLNYCKEAGVYGIMFFGAGMTLREGNREYFYQQLDHSFPGFKEKYKKTYSLNYGVLSQNHKSLWKIFHDFCQAQKIATGNDKLFAYLREFSSASNEPTLW